MVVVTRDGEIAEIVRRAAPGDAGHDDFAVGLDGHVPGLVEGPGEDDVDHAVHAEVHVGDAMIVVAPERLAADNHDFSIGL